MEYGLLKAELLTVERQLGVFCQDPPLLLLVLAEFDSGPEITLLIHFSSTRQQRP